MARAGEWPDVERPDAPRDATDPEGAGARAQTILVVDDEEDIRESLKALFETCLDDVVVVTAGSADAAFALLAKETPDLLVSDYKMPGMNGLEFLSTVADRAPHVPRILVTAFPDLEIAIRAINEARVQNFLTKPFDPEQILSVVRGLLQEQRAQQLRGRSRAAR